MLISRRAGGDGCVARAARVRTIAQGWLWRHESGVYVKFTATGAELFT